MARGQWNLAKGVKLRWDEKGLDSRFKDWWVATPRLDYPVLQRGTEARPNPPGPYCLFQIGTGVVQQRSGGLTLPTERAYSLIPLEFHIHAKTRQYPGGAKGWDDVVEVLAQDVKDAFDPGAGYLDLGVDKHIDTFCNEDFPVQEGDEEGFWTVLYDIYIDVAYAKMVAGRPVAILPSGPIFSSEFDPGFS